MERTSSSKEVRTIGIPRFGTGKRKLCKMCGKYKGWHNSYNDCFIESEESMKAMKRDDYVEKIEHWYRGTKFV